MSVTRQPTFNPGLRYAKGAGCLKCGTNQGECFDLGVSHRGYGVIALCLDHARECGIIAGLVEREIADAALARAEELLAGAIALEHSAAVEADTANADLEAIKRILDRIGRPAPAETPKELAEGAE